MIDTKIFLGGAEFEEYLEKKLVAGSERELVYKELNKISPFHWTTKRTLLDGSIEEEVTLLMCANFLNNLSIDVYFDPNGKYRSIYIETDYP
jgi:hypothetical protein